MQTAQHRGRGVKLLQTVLHEDEEMVISEDPDLGDEGTVWVFAKSCSLLFKSPFYDIEDLEEIRTWLKEAVQ